MLEAERLGMLWNNKALPTQACWCFTGRTLTADSRLRLSQFRYSANTGHLAFRPTSGV